MKVQFFSFVGEQIDFYEFQPSIDGDFVLMDLAFKAKYRVIEKVHGDYASNVISFEAYDHYGTPKFSKYKYVLLFVSEHNGEIYHEKYQFFDVDKTRSGLWAYCGTPFEYEEYEIEPKPLENIDFYPVIEYSTIMYNETFAKREFPGPVFKHRNGEAICRQGVYLDELFRIKEEAVLNSRG
ncbi:hypothetical protein [Microbulbifer sp. VAAF005]|uniref:hypothetical protein n=1 Tax=Microbulbifer sp. VAAF005 TaxID=3034230 RepID=UPI0024AD77D7|nr:hypothetical protein [Microbulbifer sp. VAAF005]WHI48028.1 hypothetical protein P0078_06505 [Microbulbifer sp. VAAF005]